MVADVAHKAGTQKICDGQTLPSKLTTSLRSRTVRSLKVQGPSRGLPAVLLGTIQPGQIRVSFVEQVVT